MKMIIVITVEDEDVQPILGELKEMEEECKIANPFSVQVKPS